VLLALPRSQFPLTAVVAESIILLLVSFLLIRLVLLLLLVLVLLLLLLLLVLLSGLRIVLTLVVVLLLQFVPTDAIEIEVALDLHLAGRLAAPLFENVVRNSLFPGLLFHLLHLLPLLVLVLLLFAERLDVSVVPVIGEEFSGSAPVILFDRFADVFVEFVGNGLVRLNEFGGLLVVLVEGLLLLVGQRFLLLGGPGSLP
jgi:hypothetical protein